MKMRLALALLTSLAVSAVVAQDSTNPPPQVATTNLMKIPNWGTDIMHYFVRENFTNAGVEPSATGVVDFKEQHQGKSDQKQFHLTLRKLAPTNTYTLLSLKTDETNHAEVASFTTDRHGSAMLRYKEIANGNGKGPGHLPPQVPAHAAAKAKGKGHESLPEGIADLTALTELVIVNTNLEAVLAADLTAPDRLHYNIKRKLVNEPVGALLQIQGSATRTHFRLQVLNLLPTNTYWLAINETVVQSHTSDSKGRLKINTLVVPPNSPLDIESVQLLDSNTNILISTELP